MDTKKIIIIEFIVLVLISLLWVNPATGNLFSVDANMIDEGQFGAWALHMLQGKHLFKDIYVTYGPLYVYPLYFLFKIFSPSVFLVRAYLVATISVGVLSAYACVVLLGLNRIARWIVAILFLLFPVITLRQGLGFLALFLYILAIKKKNVYLFGLSGIGVALTFFVSADVGIITGTICVGTSLVRYTSSQRKLSELAGIVFGILTTLGLFALWMRMEGWLIEYIDVTVDVFRSFSGVNVPNGQSFPNVLAMIPQVYSIFDWIKFLASKEMMLYWLLFFYFGVFYYLLKKFLLKQFSQSDLGLWIIFAYGLFLYPILVTRSGIGHLFFVISPAFIVGVLIVGKIWGQVKSSKNKIPARVFFLMQLIYIFLFVFRLVSIYRIDILRHAQSFFGPLSASQNEYVANIQKLTSSLSLPSDPVFFFNNEPMMYVYTMKKNPTRYDLPFIASAEEKRLEIVNSLSVSPPSLVIVSHKTWDVDDINNIRRLPEVWEFIQKHYTLIKKTADADLYKIN